MKKFLIVFLFCFIPLTGVTAQNEKYDLNKALNDLGVEQKPAHLPGVDDDTLQGDAGDVTGFLQKVINGLAALATAIAVLFIVNAGFKLIVATGESDDIANAKKSLIWSLVGLLLIIGAYIVVKTIISLAYTGEEVEGSDAPEISASIHLPSTFV